MTSKRPVTHPALHAALNDGVWRDAAIVPPAAPREPLGGAEASSGTTGRGEGADAADGRTAAVDEVTMIADVVARLTPCTCSAQRERAEKAEAERDDYREGWLSAERAVLDEREQRKDAERERDDLLAMKARVEALADDLALCTCETCEGARSVGWRLRDAIRGES